MTVFTEFAAAKVNLTLEVLGRRADGYHEIASLVAFARDATDEVMLDLSQPFGCAVSGPFAGTIAGKNLIDITFAKLAEADSNLRLGGVTLKKNLPIAAGIGGGSADAAAVLRAVRRANPEHAISVDWLDIARKLGADVPVCFENRVAWMTGIGDHLQPLSDVPPLFAVLINPLQPMPDDKTAQVFRTLRAGSVSDAALRLPPGPLGSTKDLIDTMIARGNALAAAASTVAPIIVDVKQALVETPGCSYAAISGGGPTCFGLFDSLDAALAAADALTARHPNWWIKATRLA